MALTLRLPGMLGRLEKDAASAGGAAPSRQLRSAKPLEREGEETHGNLEVGSRERVVVLDDVV